MRISSLTRTAATVFSLLLFTSAGAQQSVLLPGILGTVPNSTCQGLFVPPVWWYLIDNTGGFVSGDSVVVWAPSQDELNCPGYGTISHLSENTIGAYHGFDFGCGLLVQGGPESCDYFASVRYGNMSTAITGQVPSDSVRVFGDLWFPTSCIAIPECNAANCFTVTHVAPCDTSTAVESATWGRLKMKYQGR
jgi:hypothetical protein